MNLQGCTTKCTFMGSDMSKMLLLGTNPVYSETKITFLSVLYKLSRLFSFHRATITAAHAGSPNKTPEPLMHLTFIWIVILQALSKIFLFINESKRSIFQPSIIASTHFGHETLPSAMARIISKACGF